MHAFALNQPDFWGIHIECGLRRVRVCVYIALDCLYRIDLDGVDERNHTQTDYLDILSMRPCTI